MATLVAIGLVTAPAALGEEHAPANATEVTVAFRADAAERSVAQRFRPANHQFRAFEAPMPRGRLNLGPHLAVTFPSPVETQFECNNTVHCEYFRPRRNNGGGSSDKHAGVIVLHILGGDFELSRVCCRSLAMHGVGALFVKMPYYGPRRPREEHVRMISADLEQTVAGMTQAVLDIRRAAAWLAARDEIDSSRLGITGISLGGIISALAASSEPRFQRVCLVLAGGNLPKIILESDETRSIRDEWAHRDYDPDQVLGLLRQVDPLTYASQLRERKLLMFNARHDTTVPIECTDELWQAVGKPEIHWWHANHYSAAWYLPNGLLRMSRFFAAP